MLKEWQLSNGVYSSLSYFVWRHSQVTLARKIRVKAEFFGLTVKMSGNQFFCFRKQTDFDVDEGERLNNVV